ncbi:MAG TPA: hypothetical protein VF630_03610 [Hymenobacter sp.]|jgi:hypothetical protein
MNTTGLSRRRRTSWRRRLKKLPAEQKTAWILLLAVLALLSCAVLAYGW